METIKMLMNLVLCAVVMSACNKESSDEPVDKYNDDTKVSIIIMDKDSTDLLNPSINKFDVVLYKDTEMMEKRSEYLLLDTLPKLWNMVDTTVRYYMYFFAPLDYSKEIPENLEKIWYSTSYLSIDGATVDTIRTEVVESANSLILKKAFYNGKDLSETNGVVVK